MPYHMPIGLLGAPRRKFRYPYQTTGLWQQGLLGLSNQPTVSPTSYLPGGTSTSERISMAQLQQDPYQGISMTGTEKVPTVSVDESLLTDPYEQESLVLSSLYNPWSLEG